MKRVSTYSTMDDVAKLAGVSQSTVSRVLRGSTFVEEEKRKKVLEAVQKLDFKRNIAASKLAGSRSNEIGIIIPDIENPFFAALYKGAESALVPKGYSIMLGNSGTEKSAARAYVDKMLEHRAAGVIISSIALDPRYIAEIKERLYIVTLPIEAGVDCVTADEEHGAVEAIDYLAKECGHRRIAFWGFDKSFEQVSKRFHGYKMGLMRNGIVFDGDLIFLSGMFQEEVMVKVEENLHRFTASDSPTVIFAANDNAAINIMSALRQYGIQVPEDISIIGFDNNFISALVTPPLTTVSQPSYQMGQIAAELLLEHLDGEEERPARTVILPTKLIIRESVKKLPVP